MSEMIKLVETEPYFFQFQFELVNNLVDKEYDRFTKNTIIEMKSMFVGKTGYLDGLNLKPKIIDTSIITAYDEEQFLEVRLNAFAAVCVCSFEDKEKLVDFFSSPRGASISCSVKDRICSICGDAAFVCKHEKGKVYGKFFRRKCVHELSGVTDVYEWSIG